MTFPFHQKKTCVEQATAKYDGAKNREVLLNGALTVLRAWEISQSFFGKAIINSPWKPSTSQLNIQLHFTFQYSSITKEIESNPISECVLLN